MTAGPFQKRVEPPPSGQPTPGTSPVSPAGGLRSNVSDLYFSLKRVGTILDYPWSLDSSLSTHTLPSWMELSLWILATSFLSSVGSTCHAASVTYPKFPLLHWSLVSMSDCLQCCIPCRPWNEALQVFNTSKMNTDFCPWTNVTMISDCLLSSWYILTVFLNLNSQSSKGYGL